VFDFKPPVSPDGCLLTVSDRAAPTRQRRSLRRSAEAIGLKAAGHRLVDRRPLLPDNRYAHPCRDQRLD